MPITIGSNIASLNALRRLADNTRQVSDVYERLSSGMRINRASDDAAGLAISESLKADTRVFNQGIRNFNDGISLLNVADSALESLSNIVVRLKELAEQSANGTYSSAQRKALDTEAQALSKEYLRVIKTTSFNDKQILTSAMGELRLQGGYGLTGGIQSGLGGSVGTGNFGSKLTYDNFETNFTFATDIGDINGDGILDMVTGGFDDFNNGMTTVRFGTGNGTFINAMSYASETGSTFSVKLEDLNGDGRLDFITAGSDDSNNGYTTVRLNAGNGTFGTAISYSNGGAATGALVTSGIAIGDINGDGFADLAATATSGANSLTTVRLGSGDGLFGAAQTTILGAGNSTAIELVDLNKDGILDMITVGQETVGASGGTASVQLGNGDGTFRAVVSYVTEPLYSTSLALGDVNGDGILDLATAGSNGGDGFSSIRLGNGDGSFGAATQYTTESRVSQGIQLNDLNGDGFLDLVTAGQTDGFTGEVTIRLGNGMGSFGATTTYGMEVIKSLGLVIGDLNGDGVSDLVTAGYTSSGSGTASTRLGQTTGGTSPLQSFSLTTRADSLQALSQFDQALTGLSKQRGVIGAFQARINSAINNLQTASENFQAAASRIKDADMAAESASLVRLQILQQAAASVLGQANQQPALALKLLSN